MSVRDPDAIARKMHLNTVIAYLGKSTITQTGDRFYGF
jgi:hypothetical protein